MKRIILVLATLVAAAGCGASGPHITPDEMQANIADVEGGDPSVYVCDDTPHAHKGVITDCATVSGLSHYRVTWDDDKGHFTVQLGS